MIFDALGSLPLGSIPEEAATTTKTVSDSGHGTDEVSITTDTYYVDATGGNDSNSGRTAEQAWKTVSKVNGYTFQPNDRILFKCGETWNEQLTVPSSNLYFSSYGSGELPTISGSNTRDHCIYSSGKNNVTVNGLRATASVWETIDIRSSTGSSITNCEVVRGGNNAIAVGSSYLFDVYNNTVSGSNGNGIGINNACISGSVRYNDVSACGLVTDDRSCISVFNSGSSIQVHHNVCHDSFNTGTVGIRGIIIDTVGNNVNYVYQNLCYNCDGSGIMLYRANNQQVYYNIARNNGSATKFNDGIKWHTATGGYCYNNTCYSNRNSSIRAINSNGITIKNNIGWQTGISCVITEGTGATTHTIDYNDWYGVTNKYRWNGVNYTTQSAFFAATGQGEHDITTDPLTVSTSDFHLQDTSPCIDAGINVGLIEDFDGVTVSDPPEIGAYQSLTGAVIHIFDTSSGLDALSIYVSLSISDTGLGTDEIALLQAALKMITDTADGLDTVSIQAMLSTTEDANGQDTISLQIQLSLTETGSGSDSPEVAASLGVIDISLGGDFIGLSASVPVSEAGSASDLLDILASLSVSDVGSGLDTINILIALLKTITDTGLGSDQVNISVSLSLVDVGTGDDALTIQVSLSVTDTGLGTDTLSVLVAVLKQISDLAFGVDGLDIAASLNIGENSYGIDDPAIQALLDLLDSGLGSDNPDISASLTITDTASATDIISILQTMLVLIADSGAGSDAVSNISASIPVSESGLGADQIGQILASLLVSDVGTGVDVVVKYDSSSSILTIEFILNKPRATFSLSQPTVWMDLDVPRVDITLKTNLQ